MSERPDPTTLQQQILYLYKSQTPEEADMAATVESNHIGFNRFDAPILTSFAEQILTGRLLSDKQLQVASLRQGVSFMEDKLLWHYRCPQAEEFDAAMAELGCEE